MACLSLSIWDAVKFSPTNGYYHHVVPWLDVDTSTVQYCKLTFEFDTMDIQNKFYSQYYPCMMCEK